MYIVDKVLTKDVLTTDGRSANKFRQPQIRKCGTLRICGMRTQSIFVICGLKTPQVRKYILFFLTNIVCHALIQLYNVKIVLKRRLLGLFWDSGVLYFEEICEFAICGLIMKIIKIWGFAICRLAQLKTLQICDSGMSPRMSRFAFFVFKKKSFLAHVWC